jgi:hypothetical protein
LTCWKPFAKGAKAVIYTSRQVFRLWAAGGSHLSRGVHVFLALPAREDCGKALTGRNRRVDVNSEKAEALWRNVSFRSQTCSTNQELAEDAGK